MSRPPGRKKKTSKGFKPPRICIDSLPTNFTFLTTNMSRSNLSCQSCMCCEEEEEDDLQPCCGSQKCPKKETKQTQTQRCTAPAPIDPSCPICLAEAEKNKPSCPTCKKQLQPKKEEPRCPTCSQPVEPPCNECKKNKEDDGCPVCKKNKEDENGCPVCKKNKEDENSCPVCKSQPPPKKSQSSQSCPVAVEIPCGQGASKLNIVMMIKESDKEEPCCPEPESESESEECCKPKKAAPKKGPCCPMAIEKPKKTSPCCAPQPCCALESCKSNPIHSMPKAKTGKNGTGKIDTNEKTGKNEKSGKTEKSGKHEKSGKNDNQVICSEECKAMKEGGCCCVYPPAYKQYSCVGKISGFCDCEKPEETEDQEQ